MIELRQAKLSGLKLVILTMMLATPLFAQQPQGPSGPLPNQLAAIRKRGELRVGTAMFLPWTMHNSKGELVGFEVDVARELAENLGVEVKFFPVSQTELIPELDNGRYDIIISRLYVTPARAIFVNFTDFYARSEITLLANRKLAGNLRAVGDFNKPGLKIGVSAGTLSEELAKRMFPKASLQQYSDQGDLMDAVRSGQLHAAVSSSPRPDIDALRFPDQVFLPLAKPLSSQGEAFGIRKGDPDFINFLNAWINFHEQNGWLEERRTFWFKTLNWANDL